MKPWRMSLMIAFCLLLPFPTAQIAASPGDGTSGETFSAQTFPSQDVPKDILDNDTAGITSILNVAPSFPIVDVNLILEDLEHACVGDLKIELISPTGKKVTLIKASDEGGIIGEFVFCLENFAQTRLDDQAPTNLAAGTPPYSGSFNLEHASVDPSPLSSFNGEDAGGSWTLSISDRAVGDTGTLKAWSLEITPLVPIEEREALIAFYESTGGDDWDNNTNWRGEYGTECSWQGVRCEGGSVTSIFLTFNSLAGPLPAAIRLLTNLQSLDLEGNSLSGPIPVFPWDNKRPQLTLLSKLNLKGNSLSGPIPTDLGQLTNLESLSLAINDLSRLHCGDAAQVGPTGGKGSGASSWSDD